MGEDVPKLLGHCLVLALTFQDCPHLGVLPYTFVEGN